MFFWFLLGIFETASDRNSLVRISAADALSEALKLVSQRESVLEYVSLALRQIEAGIVTTGKI